MGRNAFLGLGAFSGQFVAVSGWSYGAHFHLEPKGLILNSPEKDR